MRKVCHCDKCNPEGEYGRVEVTELHHAQPHQAEDVRLLVTRMIKLEKEEQEDKFCSKKLIQNWSYLDYAPSISSTNVNFCYFFTFQWWYKFPEPLQKLVLTWCWKTRAYDYSVLLFSHLLLRMVISSPII